MPCSCSYKAVKQNLDPDQSKARGEHHGGRQAEDHPCEASQACRSAQGKPENPTWEIVACHAPSKTSDVIQVSVELVNIAAGERMMYAI